MKNRIPISKKGYTFCVFFTLMLSIGLGGFLTAQEITNDTLPSMVVTVPLSEPSVLSDILKTRYYNS